MHVHHSLGHSRRRPVGWRCTRSPSPAPRGHVCSLAAGQRICARLHRSHCPRCHRVDRLVWGCDRGHRCTQRSWQSQGGAQVHAHAPGFSPPRGGKRASRAHHRRCTRERDGAAQSRNRQWTVLRGRALPLSPARLCGWTRVCGLQAKLVQSVSPSNAVIAHLRSETEGTPFDRSCQKATTIDTLASASLTARSATSAPRARLRASSRIGVALGSGASRGLAHIGVMRALEEEDLHASFVAGTSMGAFIGSVYAAGSLQKLATDFLAFDWRRVAGLLDPVFPRSGLIDGQKVGAFLGDYTSHRAIEDLPLKFCAVATDLWSGAETILDSGDVTEAVRASIAVPGLLTPVRRGERILIDGGLVNPVPVSVVRAMGADVVIGVDVSIDVIENRLARIQETAIARPPGTAAAHLHEVLRGINSPAATQLDAWLHRAPMPGIVDVLMSSIYVMQAQIARASLQHHPPDLLMRPSLGSIRFMDFDRAREIIELGYQAAKSALAAWVD